MYQRHIALPTNESQHSTTCRMPLAFFVTAPCVPGRFHSTTEQRCQYCELNYHICGDFNIEYNNTQSTDVANFADLGLLDCAGFIQHVTDSTHVSGNVEYCMDLIITHRCRNIITSPVIPTTRITTQSNVSFGMKNPPARRIVCNIVGIRYSSIYQKAFTEDVRSMFATNLEKPVDCFDAYQDAVTDAVDKHAPTMTRVVTVRPKTKYTDILLRRRPNTTAPW